MFLHAIHDHAAGEDNQSRCFAGWGLSILEMRLAIILILMKINAYLP